MVGLDLHLTAIPKVMDVLATLAVNSTLMTNTNVYQAIKVAQLAEVAHSIMDEDDDDADGEYLDEDDYDEDDDE